MCDKVIYSYRAAHEKLNDARKARHPGKKIPKRAYYCEECGGWHLTSMAHYGKRGNDV